MDKIKEKYYKKLNEYYALRDSIYTDQGYRGNSGTFVDFTFITSFAFSILILGIIISCTSKELFVFILFGTMFLLLLLVSFSFYMIRKKKINKLNILFNELRDMINEYNPLFNESKLNLEDYINYLKSYGFVVEKNIIDNKRKIYILKGQNSYIKIYTRNKFFRNILKCYINDVNFRKIKNKDPKLKQLIKDYKYNSFGNNYYQMLFCFYKYILETIKDYF